VALVTIPGRFINFNEHLAALQARDCHEDEPDGFYGIPLFTYDFSTIERSHMDHHVARTRVHGGLFHVHSAWFRDQPSYQLGQ
jgi:hypothetical protein